MSEENPPPSREDVGQPETPIPGSEIPDEKVPEPSDTDDDGDDDDDE
jgi:hypothetical protein